MLLQRQPPVFYWNFITQQGQQERKERMRMAYFVMVSGILMSFMISPSLGSITEVDVEHLANVNSDFGLRMFSTLANKAVGNKHGNIFFSPASISMAFAILHLGSSNNTKKQMDDTLGFGNMLNETSNVHAVFKELYFALTPGERNAYYQLYLANHIFAEEKFQLLDTFTNDTKNFYSSPIEKLNFKTETEQSREHINTWVENVTDNKILDLLAPGAVDENTAVVLVNAIYFKANWYKTFSKKGTEKKAFRNHLGDEVTVDMMWMTSRFLYAESKYLDAKLIELFFEGDETSMILILPMKSYSLTDVHRELDHTSLEKSIMEMKSEEVHLEMPRFTLTQRVDLKPVLHKMGVRDMFNPSLADFSLISEDEKLYVSSAFHKAMIKVDESGTEASAATGIALEIASIKDPNNQKSFIADQPFIFLIRHVPTKSILFLGRIGDPTVAEGDIDQITSGAAKATPLILLLTLAAIMCVTISHLVM